MSVGWAYLAWLFVLAGDKNLWERFNWTLEIAQWPVFWDMKVVLGGIGLSAQGIDPLTADPETFGFTYNYPRAWLVLQYLGVHHLPLRWVGLVVGITWVTAFVAWCRVRSVGHACYLSSLFFAPAVMLALERANVDLVLCLVSAAAVWIHFRRSIPWLAPATFAVGAALKLYPIVGLVLVTLEARQRQRWWWWAAGAGAALFWLLNWNELQFIGARTPRVTGASFGAAVLPMRYEPWGTALFGHQLSELLVVGSGLAAYALLLAVAAWVGARLAPMMRSLNPSPTETGLYCLAAAMCCGSFALGNNFNYRLVYLFPAMPLIWRAFSSQHGSTESARWAAALLGTAWIMLFAPLNTNGKPFIISQLAGWLTIAFLAAGFFAINFGSWHRVLPPLVRRSHRPATPAR